MIEKAWGKKNSKTILLAPDWAKAFDSISPDALSGALERFGIPREMTSMISNIYSHRKFLVCEAGYKSNEHTQAFGIS